MQEVSYGSKKKYWWKCKKGHSWQTAVTTRTAQLSGCPYCSGKAVLPETSFAFTHPEIASEWHPTKNGDLTPAQVSHGSHKKVWWLGKCGHEWQANISSRSAGTGCPICSKKVVIPRGNDLASSFPDIAKQWHPTKNAALSPENVTSGSKHKVWWKCDKGHEWQAMVYSRVQGRGCPICAGKTVIPGANDLKTLFPFVAAEWHDEKNTAYNPEFIAPYSNKKVWWRCELGHEYLAKVSSRTNDGYGCPYCAGKKILVGFNDLQSQYPKIAAQWHTALNGNLTPENVTSGSHKKVWWKCSLGHIWKTVIYSRTGTFCGCPVCADKKNSPYYGLDHKVFERKLLAGEIEF